MTAADALRRPVRQVHLGLGAFHRAHQAWYSDVVNESGEWGIAAYTGRSASLADTLRQQDCRYTVIERGPDGDKGRVVESISRVGSPADRLSFEADVARESTALLTLTVSEVAYRLDHHGQLDRDAPDVSADRELVGRAYRGLSLDSAARTVSGRLVLALEQRRRAGSGPLAIVPCDNLPRNGAAVREVLLAVAQDVAPTLGEWISGMEFVDTSVDRITPATRPEDLTVARELVGWDDRAPVVTEPFHDWVLAGTFPGGRPGWERAGARFVDDIGPSEQRKLWLLNGAHTLLAAAGLRRGHATVAEAIDDEQLRADVDAYWRDAITHLEGSPESNAAYCDRLVERFANSRIEHRLAQIAEGAQEKVRVRLVPVLRAERAAGERGEATSRALAYWIAGQLAAEPTPAAAADVLRSVAPDLADDRVVVSDIAAHLAER